MAFLTKLLVVVALCLAARALDVDGAGAPAAALDVEVPEEKKFDPAGAITFEYEVGKSGSYERLQKNLRQVLKTSREVEKIPVMVEQTLPKAPPIWVLINLIGRTAQEKATLAVRNDNIYVCGFRNSAGSWFAFPRFHELLKGSTKLPRTEDYASLIGRRANLQNYDIGIETALDAVSFLARYRPAPAADKSYEDRLGISLARLIVIVSEAARFKPVLTTVGKGMREQPTRVSEKEAKLLVLWADMSKSIIGLAKTGKWVQEEKYTDAGVTSAQDAIAALNLLIWPKGETLPPPPPPPTGGN